MTVLDGDLDLALGADLKAHRPPGVTHDGAPDDSAHRPVVVLDGKEFKGGLWPPPFGGVLQATGGL